MSFEQTPTADWKMKICILNFLYKSTADGKEKEGVTGGKEEGREL